MNEGALDVTAFPVKALIPTLAETMSSEVRRKQSEIQPDRYADFLYLNYTNYYATRNPHLSRVNLSSFAFHNLLLTRAQLKSLSLYPRKNGKVQFLQLRSPYFPSLVSQKVMLVLHANTATAGQE